ncbi:MAG: hypothetical protein ACI9LY_003532, partial [Arenicella sp.]
MERERRSIGLALQLSTLGSGVSHIKKPQYFRTEVFEFGAGKEIRTPDPNLG